MRPVTIQRSGWRMWWMALGAIPLLVIGIDVLTNREITDRLRELLFRPEDTQIYEPRDVIWAWAMVLFAGLIILWALKELFAPTVVIESRVDGLVVRLRGPFRKPDVIPWEQIKDVAGGEIDDEEETLPLLAIEVLTRGELPDHPWGARWLDQRVLGVMAQDFSESADQIAVEIGEYAVAAAAEDHRRHTASIWEEK